VGDIDDAPQPRGESTRIEGPAMVEVMTDPDLV
jgi:hypothetical protein